MRLLLACLLTALVVAGCGGSGRDKPPATAAAGIVPDTALLYLHLSTDQDRQGVKDGGRTAPPRSPPFTTPAFGTAGARTV